MTVPMLILKGTHGTCATFASDIRQQGFRAGAGRRGNGSYFWGYSNTAKDYAVCLAKAWWMYVKTETRQYQSARDTSCEVLNVTINVEEDNFLDLEEHTMKQKLVPFLNDIYKRTATKEHRDLAARGYDLFVKLVEKQRTKPIKVVHVTVNPPARKYFEHQCALSLPSEACVPSCYVVKYNGCIVMQ